MTLVQFEPKAIKIGIPHDDYSAMQGPCPSGFHVPLNTEWQTVYNIWTALGGGSSAGTNFGIALKLPFAGYRLSSNSKASYQGSNGYYWSSRRYNADSAYNLRFGSSFFYTQTNYYRAYSLSVRGFKNSPVVPTSSWTKLYGTSIEAGGIFWSSSEGLISLSSHGQTWITIMDKNLGATTVWNNGDTLSEANCGKYYQRGNNYGFPRTGGVTTSSVQVNASTYGPGNYYSSSTFITYNGRWDTTDNGNLRGGVTGIVQKTDTDIKKVYLGSNQVRPKVRTFTISWTEQSNMSSGWTYSDDAAGLTAGSTAFDEFFGYSAVRLNSAGVETAEITQSGSGGNGKLNINSLGTLTSGDNVMIKFPVRGIKMSKSGSTVTLSITDGLNRSGYQYYAFQKTGDVDSNTENTATYPLYLGTYLSYKSNNVLKSWSGQTPQGSNTMANELSYASANGTGWTIMGWYQRCLINAYYIMKYGNPDSQSVVGKGFVDSNNSATHITGGTNSQSNATYGSSNGTIQCKLFGLEDWWGNQYQQLGGVFVDGSYNMYVALHNFTANISTSESQYKYIGSLNFTSSQELSSIIGTNKQLFAPYASTSNSNYNTYYCDYVYLYSSTFAIVGGDRTRGASAGAFDLKFNFRANNYNARTGSRLMYL